MTLCWLYKGGERSGKAAEPPSHFSPQKKLLIVILSGTQCSEESVKYLSVFYDRNNYFKLIRTLSFNINPAKQSGYLYRKDVYKV
jgi:hypothetical protein